MATTDSEVTLGTEVRRLRESRGLTQAQMAVRSHLGMTFIWSVENDREVNCCDWQIGRLAKVLGVSVGDLLPLIPRNRRILGRTDPAA